MLFVPLFTGTNVFLACIFTYVFYFQNALNGLQCSYNTQYQKVVIILLLCRAVFSIPASYFFCSIFSRKKYCRHSWVLNFFWLGVGGLPKVRGGFFRVGRSFFSAVFIFPAVFFFVKNRGACRFFVFFFAVRFNGFCVKKCFSRVYFYVYFLFPKRTQTLVMLAHRVKSIGRRTNGLHTLYKVNKDATSKNHRFCR